MFRSPAYWKHCLSPPACNEIVKISRILIFSAKVSAFNHIYVYSGNYERKQQLFTGASLGKDALGRVFSCKVGDIKSQKFPLRPTPWDVQGDTIYVTHTGGPRYTFLAPGPAFFKTLTGLNVVASRSLQETNTILIDFF